MRKLRRQPGKSGRPARAAVVVPTALFWRWSLCSNQGGFIKELQSSYHCPIAKWRLRTLYQHPTNLLFFDRSGPTKEVWYYEQPLPEGRKNYTRPNPSSSRSSPLVWRGEQKGRKRMGLEVPATDLLTTGCNFDRKNPRAKDDITHLPPEQLVASILQKEQRIWKS